MDKKPISPLDFNPFITPVEAAQLVGCNDKEVRKWVRTGKCPMNPKIKFENGVDYYLSGRNIKIGRDQLCRRFGIAIERPKEVGFSMKPLFNMQ